jgi:hypothetical protein
MIYIRFLGIRIGGLDLIGSDWIGLELELWKKANRCVPVGRGGALIVGRDQLMYSSLPAAEPDAGNILQYERTFFPVLYAPGRAH